MREIHEAILEVLRSGGRGALATVVRTGGSTPQEPGARLLLRPDGRLVGTIGGGAIEEHVIEALRECARSGKGELLSRDLARDLGMCCGGRMEIFVEPIESMPRLLLFGAGHVAKPTAAIARSIGFDVVVIDDREELNDETRFPHCKRVLAEPKEAAAALCPTERDFLLVVTHDHRLDEEALDTYARLPHAYLGMIGSVRKIVRILQRIEHKRGLPPLDRVHAPVGLDLGAVSPEEIAVSIAAELVALRHGKVGATHHLRCLDDPAIRRVMAADAEDDDTTKRAEQQS